MSAKVSVNHIIPDSDKTYNTRSSTPLRRRQNFREKRPNCENKNYSDNLDVHHLDSPPSKRSKRRNVAQTLREPSANRLNAQSMITRGELQRSVSPKFTRKLIGTAIKQEDKKPKVKLEEDFSRNTRRLNRSWPKDAKLVHLDRTPCSEECMKSHPDDDDVPASLNKSIKVTYGNQNKELQAVPGTLDETPTDSVQEKDDARAASSTAMELCDVPDKTMESNTKSNTNVALVTRWCY